MFQQQRPRLTPSASVLNKTILRRVAIVSIKKSKPTLRCSNKSRQRDRIQGSSKNRANVTTAARTGNMRVDIIDATHEAETKAENTDDTRVIKVGKGHLVGQRILDLHNIASKQIGARQNILSIRTRGGPTKNKKFNARRSKRQTNARLSHLSLSLRTDAAWAARVVGFVTVLLTHNSVGRPGHPAASKRTWPVYTAPRTGKGTRNMKF